MTVGFENSSRYTRIHLMRFGCIETSIRLNYLCKKEAMAVNQSAPIIRRHLLWEYDWETIDFSRMKTVVIERVIERGTPSEWQEIVNFYGVDEILRIAEKSTRLDDKHKRFTRIYLQSGFIHDSHNLCHGPVHPTSV